MAGIECRIVDLLQPSLSQKLLRTFDQVRQTFSTSVVFAFRLIETVGALLSAVNSSLGEKVVDEWNPSLPGLEDVNMFSASNHVQDYRKYMMSWPCRIHHSFNPSWCGAFEAKAYKRSRCPLGEVIEVTRSLLPHLTQSILSGPRQ
jgi:hypothetical protein